METSGLCLVLVETGQFLKRWNSRLQNFPEIPPIGIYVRELETQADLKCPWSPRERESQRWGQRDRISPWVMKGFWDQLLTAVCLVKVLEPSQCTFLRTWILWYINCFSIDNNKNDDDNNNDVVNNKTNLCLSGWEWPRRSRGAGAWDTGASSHPQHYEWIFAVVSASLPVLLQRAGANFRRCGPAEEN